MNANCCELEKGSMVQSKETNSIIWSAIERFSTQGVQFVLSIIIARFVSPSDYGLIAMLAIFLSVAQQFVDSGFSNAIIQKKDRKEIDYYTVFYFNLIISVAVYAVLYVSSHYIASFYSEPKLEIITKWIGLNIILTAFYIIPRTKFTVELNFKIQTKISLISVTVSGFVGVLLAWCEYGVWALVIQSLLNNFLSLLLFLVVSKWRLQWMFSWNSFKSLYSFGSKLLAVGILHVICTNIYTLIIGRFFNSVDVGYFNRSQAFVAFPSVNISSIVGRVLYPVQCQIQSEDELLKKKFIQYLRMTAYIVFPLMIGFCVLSKPFILIVLTDKWLPAANILSILCLAYMWFPLTSLNWQLLTAKGRSDLALKAEILGKIVSFIILLLTLPFGIMAICYGIIVANIIDTIVIIYYVKKVVDVSYWSELKILFPIMTVVSIMGGCVYVTQILLINPYWQLSVGVLVGMLAYIFFSFVFKLEEIKSMQLFFSKYSMR